MWELYLYTFEIIKQIGDRLMKLGSIVLSIIYACYVIVISVVCLYFNIGQKEGHGYLLRYIGTLMWLSTVCYFVFCKFNWVLKLKEYFTNKPVLLSLFMILTVVVFVFFSYYFIEILYNAKETGISRVKSIFFYTEMEMPDMVKYLLDKKADPNKMFKDGKGKDCNTLTYAAFTNQPQIINYLIEAKADPNQKTLDEISTPLLQAVHENHIESIKALLKNKSDPNISQTESCASPIHYAAKEQNHTVLRLLLKAKAKPNTVTDKGGTPLHFAINTNNQKTLRILMKAKANPNLQHINIKLSPLMFAISRRSFGIFKALIKYGANCEISENFYGVKVSPLSYAEQNQFDKAIRFINKVIKKKNKDKLKNSAGELCPICFEKMETIGEMKITPCHHVFHEECWDDYKEHHERTSSPTYNLNLLFGIPPLDCPVCRETIY